jgi:hypothetical protein
MNDNKFLEMCRKMATETDSAELAKVCEELIKLLAEEQSEIRQKIKANLKNIIPGS